MTTPLTPDLAAARRALYANAARNAIVRARLAKSHPHDGRHSLYPVRNDPAMLAAGPVVRARKHRAELARWRALGTPVRRDLVRRRDALGTSDVREGRAA